MYGFAASTTATDAVPIPFADMPLLIGQQVAMLTSIASIFEISIGQDALRSLVLGAIGMFKVAFQAQLKLAKETDAVIEEYTNK